ncbi:MAG: tRNA (adenosine(37)-N6)-threonylcarbamoyltransferase complex transferase subunit TsaD [Clostridia bacterium]|nr:tRNA (adenosine(37)-N6)-threonylcarbamoyltransferase complex transferase subunit TsaD [Clostridia bacterium]
MLILSIESSCDETAAAVVEDGRCVLSSIINSQVAEHKIYGGVVPEIASRRHAENISGVVRQAVNDAGVPLSRIDAVAVTHAPGLIGALLVGVSFAKGLSYSLKKPLVPVHHLRSHIAANYIAHPRLEPPFLCLVASGGHSHIVECRGYTDFSIVGCTRDDAAGEAFDKAARTMGLPYPGGVHLDRLSQTGDPNGYKFPHVRVEGYDFSFSGLKTNVINMVHNAQQKGEALRLPDLAASFQMAVVGQLCEKLVRAADDLKYGKIVVAGGVSANSALRGELQRICAQTGRELFMPPLSLCGDNAAMVGAQGYYEYLAGNTADLTLNGSANMSIE